MDIYFNEARSFSDGKSDMDRHDRAKTFADASHLPCLPLKDPASISFSAASESA